MAFIIRSKLEEYLKINQDGVPEDPWSWRPIQKVEFTNDGTLKTPINIALGNQGDDWATCLECSIDGYELEDYIDRYSAHLVCVPKNNPESRTPLDLVNNKYVYIPQEITENAGEYQMVLVVAEKDNEESTTPTPEQAANEQEFFTSQVFGGSVAPSLFPVIQKFHEIHGAEALLSAPEVNLNETSLSKPLITLHATRGVLNPIDKSLGYLYDRFITPIEITTEWSEGNNEFDAILLYFITKLGEADENTVGVLAYSVLNPENTTPERILAWVPEQVTSRAGTWQIVMVGVDENGSEWYSNTITGQVIDNTLQAGDLDPTNASEAFLYTSEDDLVVVSLNDLVEVPLKIRSTSGESYKLNYTGAEVQALLDSIPTKQDQLTAGENIEITETDVISAEVPTFGVDKETGTLVVNTNKTK